MRTTILLALVLFTASQLQGQSVAGGGRHSVAICQDGSIICWGYNGHGQVGTDGRDEQPSGVPVSGIQSASSVAAGLFHTIVVLQDGTVQTFGRNTQGQLGDGTTTLRRSPVRVVGVTNIVAAAGGGEHSLFLDADGVVWACGLNSSGQLGDGTRTTRTQPVRINGLPKIKRVAAGAEFSLFLDHDGNVWACGHNGNKQFGTGTTTSSIVPVRIPDLQDVVGISAGEWHSLFVLGNGSVYGAGHNMYGQIGSDTLSERHNRNLISFAERVVQADAGGIHSVFVTESGRAYACGLNSNGNNNGQLGDGTTMNRSAPVAVTPTWGAGTVRYVQASREHSLFVLDDGRIYGCGRNNYGQLATGSVQTQNALSPIYANATCITTSVRHEEVARDDQNPATIVCHPTRCVVQLPVVVKGAILTVMDMRGRAVYTAQDVIGSSIDIPTHTLANGCYVALISEAQNTGYQLSVMLYVVTN